MQKILIEITTVNDAKPEAVAETLTQMTGRQCRLVIPPAKAEIMEIIKGHLIIDQNDDPFCSELAAEKIIQRLSTSAPDVPQPRPS